MSSNQTPQPAPSEDQGVIQVVNDRDAIEGVQARVMAAVERHNFPKAAVFAIRLSLHEAVSNAFNHGHRGLPPTEPVTVSFDVDDAAVRIAVEDRGPGFSPQAVPDPTLDENIENTSGRGLMLMKAYMSDVRYNDRGNRIEMTYERPGA